MGEAVLAAFTTQPGIKRWAVFGSALRADFGPESDIDLLVEFEPGRTPGLLSLAAMELELAKMIGREVELLQNVRAVAADYAAANAAGNFDIAAVIAGEAVGLIHDIPSAAEIVDRIVTDADQILRGRRNSSSA